MLREHTYWIGVLVFGACTLLSALPVSAQQDPSWQGPRVRQPTVPVSPPQAVYPPVPQPSSLPKSQPRGEEHPQVMEMPEAQPPLSSAPQPASSSSQSVAVPSSQQSSVTSAPSSLPTKPAYFGVVGRTALACRYPAGVRISHVIESSPAHQAGLKGEATLSWKNLLGPGASRSSSSRSSDEHGGRGDLILAIDGKRIHNLEELQQEMERFRPGDVIYVSILRGESGLGQIPVRLTEHPNSNEGTGVAEVAPSAATSSGAQQARGTKVTPGS